MTAVPDSGGKLSRREARLAKRRQLAFRVARRHTWLVKALRFVLPTLAAGMVATYATLLFGRLSVRIGPGTLEVKGIEITADDLKMKGVTYDGVTKDGGRYVVKARDALVDIQQKGPVSLTQIDGDFTQQSGVVTNLKSTRGILDNAKGEMDLLDGVVIDASNGLKARMKSAKVFNKENRIVANEGVEADTATGRIKAETMEFETKSRKGVFTGNVAVRMTPDQTNPAKSPLAGLGGGESRLPLDMTAQKLDIDDTARLAILTGGVTAVQGESQLVAQALRVTYEGRVALPGLPVPALTATPLATTSRAGLPPAELQQTKLSKLYASGQVVITQGAERRIVAETLDVDVAADTALFAGPAVEVQQGKNRLFGRRLEIDRKSGKSRLTSPAEGRLPAGQIKTTFVQDQKTATGAPIKAARPVGAAVAAAAAAVPEGGGGLMNFKTDPNAPIDIEAETLDVNDPAKQAIYRKAVRAQQGDFVIQSAELIAHYTGDTGLMATTDPQAAKDAAPKDAAPKGQGPQVTRIEANNDVIITSKGGQEARGKKAVFEQKTNIVVLTGDVVVKQERTVITGTRLKIDLTTGIANFENDGSQPSIGSALSAAGSTKSAPGPGGLPQVGGVQLPAAPAPVGSGRQSAVFYPDDFKKQKDSAKGDKSNKIVPKVAPKSTTDGWQPSTSPSPVYRAP